MSYLQRLSIAHRLHLLIAVALLGIVGFAIAELPQVRSELTRTSHTNQTTRTTEEIAAVKRATAATAGTVGAIEGFGGITRTVNKISSAIAAAFEEQNATTGEIACSIDQAVQGTGEISAGVLEVNEAATRMLGASRALSGQAEALRRQVETFLAGIRSA